MAIRRPASDSIETLDRTPLIAEFFGEWESVRAPCGDRSRLENPMGSDYGKVGRTFVGENVLRRVSDGVLVEVEDGFEPSDGEEGYPSVDHWLASAL